MLRAYIKEYLYVQEIKISFYISICDVVVDGKYFRTGYDG